MRPVLMAAAVAASLFAFAGVAQSQSCQPVTINCSQLAQNCRNLCQNTANPQQCAATACTEGLRSCRASGRFQNQYGCRQTNDRS
jgi:hypothetical protein